MADHAPPHGSADGWTRVSVTVDAAQAELVADQLWAFDPAAIEERDDEGSITLLAGFADPVHAERAADHLLAFGGAPREVHLLGVDDDGLDAWRAWARPVAAGPFWIVPAWLADDADPIDPAGRPDRRPLLVDPGHSFGSGSHPTTRLVLARLAELVGPGCSVLDVGCGSGILAVGAALLGASTVEGIDLDVGAPDATAANATTNGVDGVVRASCTPLAEVAARSGDAGRFDVVAANLLAPVVRDLALDLVRVVAPGGALVVSGLLVDRWEDAVGHLTVGGGLEVTDVATEEGWVAVTLRS